GDYGKDYYYSVDRDKNSSNPYDSGDIEKTIEDDWFGGRALAETFGRSSQGELYGSEIFWDRLSDYDHDQIHTNYETYLQMSLYFDWTEKRYTCTKCNKTKEEEFTCNHDVTYTVEKTRETTNWYKPMLKNRDYAIQRVRDFENLEKFVHKVKLDEYDPLINNVFNVYESEEEKYNELLSMERDRKKMDEEIYYAMEEKPSLKSNIDFKNLKEDTDKEINNIINNIGIDVSNFLKDDKERVGEKMESIEKRQKELEEDKEFNKINNNVTNQFSFSNSILTNLTGDREIIIGQDTENIDLDEKNYIVISEMVNESKRFKNKSEKSLNKVNSVINHFKQLDEGDLNNTNKNSIKNSRGNIDNSNNLLENSEDYLNTSEHYFEEYDQESNELWNSNYELIRQNIKEKLSEIDGEEDPLLETKYKTALERLNLAEEKAKDIDDFNQ
ncbi:MAG: hypothetical protein ACOCP8_02845, partial [archaeon]